ncbi:/ / chromosome replication initiation protein-like protein / 100249:100827 Forward [Candidatus Hepatoplasma crinochetorum]|uniref:/ / chromosome replication initiation protein-like protein / 100249:100827 Forward n=1 Tax=Candidatus Hepatoplasma crinochetorum TaxID=295596 RepID=A0A0G7ZNE5_9MOLU|nr:/ / chromosome replication initiation protein-like protein / 100249:100827 Forward [Candidatus Hepatoplasma crinochetorum]
MIDVGSLLHDNLINKERLLLKKYKLLGLKEQEVLLVISILNFDSSENISLNKIAKGLDISKSNVDKILTSLVQQKLIKIDLRGKEISFNFNNLWERLLNLYYIPNDNSSKEDRYYWFIKRMNFNNNTVVKVKFENWIEQKLWSKIIEVIDKLEKFNFNFSVSWNEFEKIIDENIKPIKKDINQILHTNWLTE